MAEKRIREQERWQLRHAAGSYWLLDMEQGLDVRKGPLSLNQAGADLWELLQRGTEEEAAADMLCRRYQLDRERALEDVRQFFSGLEARGIVVE